MPDFSGFGEYDLEVRLETKRLLCLYGYEPVTNFKMFETLSGYEFKILGKQIIVKNTLFF